MAKIVIPVEENLNLKPGVNRSSGKQRYMMQMEWQENKSSVPVSLAACI